MKYIGPEYNAGIILPNGDSVRPREWTKDQKAQYIKLYPFIAEWFSDDKAPSSPT